MVRYVYTIRSIRIYFYRKISKEIEPRCAEALCRLFPSDPTIDIISIATKAKNNNNSNLDCIV